MSKPHIEDDLIIVRLSGPPMLKDHKCSLPGYWARRRLGIRVGGRVQCKACGTYWEWYRADGGGYVGTYWTHIKESELGVYRSHPIS